MNSPCKDCKDRAVNCHSVCVSYKEYRKIMDDRNKKITNKRIADANYNLMRKSHILKTAKSK